MGTDEGHVEAAAVRPERLLEALRAFPDPLFVFDGEHRCAFATPAAAAALGREPSELLGKTCRELGLPPDVSRPFEAALASVLAGGETIRGELLGVAVPEGRCDFEYVLCASTEGQLAVCAVREVTARRATEQALDRVTRLQLVTAALSSALTREEVAEIVVNQGVAALGARAGSLVVLDGAAKELTVLRAFNYSEGALAGWRKFPLAAPVLVADVVRQQRPLAVGSRAELRRRYPLMAASIDLANNAWASTPLLVDDRVLGAITLSFEEEREFPDDELDFMLTLARQCAQAFERARLLERPERKVTEPAAVLARLSHELRTPLAVLSGGVETLRHRWDVLDEETRLSVVEAMTAPVRRLSRLIDDLLMVAEIESGVFSMGNDETELAELLRIAATEAALSERHHVTLALGEDELRVRGEPRRLYRALWAVVENALAFSPGGGEIALRADRAGSTIVVTVRDDGIGIPDGERERIFEKFHQLDAPRGAGIGLYLARAIVERLGGRISVATSSELGSTLAIELPAA